ncbi:MAG: CRISPR-associated endoribonuclease Cas6 [Bacteroidetes bacterium]|nr:MAG: CRISPR-associated endoribonuclease Cas6 [Bacteroidota bacterium]
MRLKLKLSKNKTTVPFNYQQKLVGTIHKWMGRNDEHGKQSVFSFSQLQSGEVMKNGFNFPEGSTLYFSSTDNKLLTNIYKGIKDDPTLFCGLKVYEIDMISEPAFRNRERFPLLSPLFFKQKIEGKNKPKHFTFEDEETEILLTEAVKRRLEFNEIPDDTLKITFDKTYQGKKTKVINYRGIGNKTSVCPIIVEGKFDSMEFLWNNGVGHSTGIGFGCLK